MARSRELAGRWTFVVALAVSVAACGAGDPANLDAEEVVVEPPESPLITESESVAIPNIGRVDGPVLVSPLPESDELVGMAAEVKGTVIFDNDTECLLLELEGVSYPLVWPAGTSWRSDPPGVRLDNGEIVEPGMTVHGGGGYLKREGIEHMAGTAVADAAATCAGPTGETAIFNIGSTVTVTAG